MRAQKKKRRPLAASDGAWLEPSVRSCALQGADTMPAVVIGLRRRSLTRCDGDLARSRKSAVGVATAAGAVSAGRSSTSAYFSLSAPPPIFVILGRQADADRDCRGRRCVFARPGGGGV